MESFGLIIDDPTNPNGGSHVSAANPLPVQIVGGAQSSSVQGAALDGTDDPSVAPASGAVGIRGWLSTGTGLWRALVAAVGTPTDATWSGTGAMTIAAGIRALYGKLAGVLSVTINGALPAGANFLGYFGLNSAFTFTTAFAAALPAASAWQKVATTTTATKLLRMDYPAATTTYDAEWTWVAANATAPTGGLGTAILAGEDFNRGFPIGDIYMRSATAQIVIVQTGA